MATQPKTPTAKPTKKPQAIGIWVYCTDEAQKARYELAARRSRYGSTSAFMQAAADQLAKLTEKKHGPITDEELKAHLAAKGK